MKLTGQAQWTNDKLLAGEQITFGGPAIGRGYDGGAIAGEMGFGLPGALGASIAKNKSDVICLNCDGGIMMNLQELQSIKSLNLNIIIFLINNNGYLSIKQTQKNFFKNHKNIRWIMKKFLPHII